MGIFISKLMRVIGWIALVIGFVTLGVQFAKKRSGSFV